jgi:purine-binding chemotaxis protein CheW
MSDISTLESNCKVTTTGKFLTFLVGRESYGISVLQVREIIKLAPITAIPQAPAYVKGVINLRGKIVPVVDLRLKFNQSAVQATERTCIIVVEAHLSGSRSTQIGIIVDGVEDVANLTAADVETPPEFGAKVSTDYIAGMAKIKGAVKTLLNIDKVLASSDIPALNQSISQ